MKWEIDLHRQIPSSFAPTAVAEIDHRLSAIEREEHVTIALAVESGSRAWGFPSPDSDYDCRFIFVRSLDASFSLFPKRDFIETPLTALIDVNGWELSKALRLLLAGNATIIEWLTSPIRYRENHEFRSAFLQLAEQICDRRAMLRHYYYMGRKQQQQTIGNGENVAIKKLFYALRPAMVLRWMRIHADARLAPMHFPTLLHQADLSGELQQIIDDLLQRKAETREMGHAPAPRPVVEFLRDELAVAEEQHALQKNSAAQQIAAVEQVDAFWKQWLNILNRQHESRV